MEFSTLEATIGNTPLVRLQRLPGDTSNTVLVKLEGNNPAGSVKDRPALTMIKHAEERGEIKPGDTLIEASHEGLSHGADYARTHECRAACGDENLRCGDYPGQQGSQHGRGA